MNRRRFLKGAGLLAFLTACRITGALREGATTIPSRTPWPTFTATPSPTGLPTATAPPTESVEVAAATSPVETPTSAPAATATPTPTPTPTPYPPGPPSKLGLFLARHNSKALEIIAKGKPPLVKTLELDPNFARGIKDSSPHSILIGRIFLEQQNLDVDPIPLARQFVEKLLPLASEPTRMAAFDAWEAYNEPVADTPDKMKRLADFEAERVRLLAEQGIRSVVGNFGTGHPPLELWPHFQPALEAIRHYNGYLGLHEYSAPIMQFRAGAYQMNNEPEQGDEGWLTLRYRKAYRYHLAPMGFGDTPALITECGVDGLVKPRPGPDDAKGWQDFIDTWLANGFRNDPPGVYMDQLLWYDANLQQDDYIKGAAIFLAGNNDEQWNSYDITGPAAGRLPDLLGQYLEVHPPA
jgi:hypothetical protein